LLESPDISAKTLPARHWLVLFDTRVFALGICVRAPDRLISGISEVAGAGYPVRATSRLGDPQERDMNKRDLIDAIADRMGDKKTATEAVNAVLEAIQAAVAEGDKVSITGFGVFEKSDRPARTARNPATGAAIKVPKTSVPKFRAGADFKALVNGDKKVGASR
jgi:DNA-binding protein HU-beta